VQVDSFELYLPQGPDSALAANGNLCTQKLMMPSTFTAQDGAQLKQDTKIEVTGCTKTKKKKKKVKAHDKNGKAANAGMASKAHSGHGRIKR
jgi:glucose-6-phosphate 1-dehydrogenase